jgi:hypothetical protein
MALPATDAFTGSDGTSLTAHSASWTMNHGAMAITSNAIRGNTASDDSMAHWNADSFSNDHYSKSTVAAKGIANDNHGPAVRCDASTLNGYAYFFFDNSDSRILYKVVNGSFTALGTKVPAGITVGDVMELQCSGTTITAKNNGTTESFGAITDSAFSSGSAGIGGYSNGTAARIENWEGGNLGGGGGAVQQRLSMIGVGQ